jgi:hypothetical protein
MTNDNNDPTPEEQELFDALKAGAVAKMNNAGELVGYISHDDLDAETRECIRIARKSQQMFAGRVSYKPTTPEELAFQKEQRQHHATCPSCIECRGDSAIMDADWWATEADHDPAPYPDGTRRSPEQASAEIYTEAADDFEEAAKIREARGEQDEAAELRRKVTVSRQLAALVRQKGLDVTDEGGEG